MNWWRAKTTEGMVVLGKLPDGIFTLLRFNDEGGQLTHISESEALWFDVRVSSREDGLYLGGFIKMEQKYYLVLAKSVFFKLFGLFLGKMEVLGGQMK
ncbi:Uncharacterised protein [Streptococcus agalactiae]|nr:Uncharacterised protein [Streptococcus agalactiae]